MSELNVTYVGFRPTSPILSNSCLARLTIRSCAQPLSNVLKETSSTWKKFELASFSRNSTISIAFSTWLHWMQLFRRMFRSTSRPSYPISELSTAWPGSTKPGFDVLVQQLARASTKFAMFSLPLPLLSYCFFTAEGVTENGVQEADSQSKIDDLVCVGVHRERIAGSHVLLDSSDERITLSVANS